MMTGAQSTCLGFWGATSRVKTSIHAVDLTLCRPPMSEGGEAPEQGKILS
jgi:hypothetical protein